MAKCWHPDECCGYRILFGAHRGICGLTRRKNRGFCPYDFYELNKSGMNLYDAKRKAEEKINRRKRKYESNRH